jgi:hypothetical protein
MKKHDIKVPGTNFPACPLMGRLLPLIYLDLITLKHGVSVLMGPYADLGDLHFIAGKVRKGCEARQVVWLQFRRIE